jgi:ABC-type multidrug transport system ATPase subunit
MFFEIIFVGLFSNVFNFSSMLHQNHERVTDPSLCPCVEIRNLVKCYSKKKGAIPAVNKFSFSLYQDQITALLGHNGAGYVHINQFFLSYFLAACCSLTSFSTCRKTTLVSILTGMIQPTEGDCIIDGYSIVDENLEARRSMSLCPQENILFERLTVFEHIAFFMRIKGCTSPTKAEVRSRAEEVGLAEFFYRRAAALSGGNKRKLCLAAAFCGDPKFLVLDEPTSGMGKFDVALK